MRQIFFWFWKFVGLYPFLFCLKKSQMKMRQRCLPRENQWSFFCASCFCNLSGLYSKKEITGWCRWISCCHIFNKCMFYQVHKKSLLLFLMYSHFMITNSAIYVWWTDQRIAEKDSLIAIRCKMFSQLTFFFFFFKSPMVFEEFLYVLIHFWHGSSLLFLYILICNNFCEFQNIYQEKD